MSKAMKGARQAGQVALLVPMVIIDTATVIAATVMCMVVGVLGFMVGGAAWIIGCLALALGGFALVVWVDDEEAPLARVWLTRIAVAVACFVVAGIGVTR